MDVGVKAARNFISLAIHKDVSGPNVKYGRGKFIFLPFRNPPSLLQETHHLSFKKPIISQSRKDFKKLSEDTRIRLIFIICSFSIFLFDNETSR